MIKSIKQKKTHQSNLLVGVSTVDITPSVGAVLIGYGERISLKISHSLRAEAIVCRQGNREWALVTVDLLGIPQFLAQKVRRRIYEQIGLSPDAVLIAATHTHSAPAVRCGMEAELSEKLAGIVVTAHATASPAKLEFATTSAPGLASNRRIQNEDGEWINEWQDPDGKHTGFFNSTVSLVGIRRPNYSLDALLVNYGCHPVTLGQHSLAISGDYVSYLKDSLENHEDAATVMFTLSGHANIDPLVCVQNDPEITKHMGESLAQIVRNAIPELSQVSTGSLASHSESWRIVRTDDLPNIGVSSYFRATQTGQFFDTEVMALRSGGLAFVSVPGELFSEFTETIQKASPAQHTIVVSLGNDYIGYLPTDEAQKEGAYEITLAPAAKLEKPLLAKIKKALCKTFALLIISFFCQIAPASMNEVSLNEIDVDGDGVSEFVLENEYVRLVLDRGVSPQNPNHDRYGARFVWGGWIRELSWRPTKREFFLLPRRHDDFDTIFTGMPEEFEQIIPINNFIAKKQKEDSLQKDLLLKIGSGICQGIRTGPSSWKDISLKTAAPWEVETSDLHDGGKVVTFKQILMSVGGYAYVYTKRFRMHPGRSSVIVRRTLENIGQKEIKTTWYLHPCFAQGSNNQYDHNCWSTAPVALGNHPSSIDTSNCIPPQPTHPGIWGALSGKSIPEPWIASGHTGDGEILATLLDKPIEWLRFWTWTHCYAVEPFVCINLIPGETWESTTHHILGAGLSGVTGIGKGGFVKLKREKKRIRVSFLPDRHRDTTVLKLSVQKNSSDKIILNQTCKLDASAPDDPVIRDFAITADGTVTVKVAVMDEYGENELVRIERALNPPQEAPAPIKSDVCRILILSTPQNTNGKPQSDIAFLLPYLKNDCNETHIKCRQACDRKTLNACNCINRFEVRLVDVAKTTEPAPDWGAFDCVVVAGNVEVPASLQTWIRKYIYDGGGLFQAGPLSLAETSLAEILPVTIDGGTVSASFMPYGANRRVGDIPVHRLHMQKAAAFTSHPIISGLPFWPAVGQDIGCAQIVTPKDGAMVLLHFINGGDFPQFEDKPALVINHYGKGRTAVLACSVAWGTPPVWVNYARLGEYHRKLLIQCIMWTAGMNEKNIEIR